MPSTIICPNCRRPQEESGRLTCPDCSAILPSHHQPATATATQTRPAASASSALDDFTIPQRPSGAMTLLRNDLRSEDKSKPQGGGGWLDNIMPAKKSREATEVEEGSKPRAIRETPKPGSSPASTPDGSTAEPKARPQAKVAPQAPNPIANAARIERPTPDHSSLLGNSNETEDGLSKQVPILGVVAGVVFALVAALALLQGKEALLGCVLLVTVSILGASILGVWHRQRAQKAFWQGFAVFGLAYLGLSFVPVFLHDAGLELPTAPIIRVVHAKLLDTPVDARNSFEIMKALPVMSEAVALPLADADPAQTKAALASTSFFALGDVRQFTVVGQCFFTLAFALLGSTLARWFYRSSLAV